MFNMWNNIQPVWMFWSNICTHLVESVGNSVWTIQEWVDYVQVADNKPYGGSSVRHSLDRRCFMAQPKKEKGKRAQCEFLAPFPFPFAYDYYRLTKRNSIGIKMFSVSTIALQRCLRTSSLCENSLFYHVWSNSTTCTISALSPHHSGYGTRLLIRRSWGRIPATVAAFRWRWNVYAHVPCSVGAR